MSDQRNIISELLNRNCLITPECYEILEDIDYDSIDIDRLAEELKNEIVITGEKLLEALAKFEDILSEGGEISREEMIEKLSESENDLSVSQKTIPVIDSSIISEEIEEEIKIVEKISTKTKIDFDPIGKKIKKQIKILADSTGKTMVEGNITDFKKYFNSRYTQ
ncbi:MAG: hypothetical protein ACFFDW_12425, partial [Candidatus Thorarchaeota archaeon]